MFSRVVLVLLAFALSAPGVRTAADPVVTGASAPALPDVSKARQRLRVAPGLQVDLWAGEPLVRNITSVSFDDTGRAYVVETGRRRTSVFDIRNFKDWVPDDLALRSVEARADYLKGMLATNSAFLNAATQGGKGGFRDFTGDGVVDVRDLEVESERIRIVWDADQDGHADSAATFADGFHSSVSGVAAGILAQGTNVWFTCIPDLWRIPAAPATAPDGRRGELTPLNPQARERMFHGFGVHIAYGGHDLHGLIRGPDGRIYFTIADRGATVTNREGRVLSVPDAGSVFRCETDGSKLEVFATGLRNPQELAFDELGNLWTGDNNGDGGDQARWTLVLEGADYGWTIGWQWLPKMGAWNSERLWHARESNTAAYLVPPVAHVGHGPAGIAYYPGTGLGDRFQGSFFYADFPGGVRTFRVEPDGAFFRIAPNPENPGWLQDNSVTNIAGKLLWDLSPVDVTFPPDGGVVVADWVEGWEKTGKGRLWRVTDPALANDPVIAETKRLLAEGMASRSADELARLLGHRDMRVRLNAQWELADRGMKSWKALSETATENTNRLARLHSVWGMGQIVRTGSPQPSVADLIRLLPLLDDQDAEVKGQAARFFGQAHLDRAKTRLRELISESDSRLAMQGTLAYRDLFGAFSVPNTDGRRMQRTVRQKLYELLPARVRVHASALRDDDGLAWADYDISERIVRHGLGDPASRHAAVLMVARLGETVGSLSPTFAAHFAQFINHTNADVRLVYLLAERRFGEPAIRRSLSDPDPRLVLESARAINDVPIPAALPDLAALLQPEALARLLKQASEFGGAAAAPRSTYPFTPNEWLTYVLRRAVNAAFRQGTETNATDLAALSVRTDLPEGVRVEALEDLGLWAQPPPVDRVVGLHRPLPARDPAPARVALAAVWSRIEAAPGTNLLIAALNSAEALRLEGLPERLEALTRSPDPVVRAEIARRRSRLEVLPVAELMARLDSGPAPQRQQALRALAVSSDPQAGATLERWAERLNRGEVPAALQLDVLESIATRLPKSPALAAWTNSWRKDDRLAAYRISLEGGDAARGRRLFAERADWGCQRCHKLGGEGGDIGPDLTGVGRTRGREAVLQSILYPNDTIAPGFENLIVTRRDGTVVVGVLKAERPEALELLTPEEGRVVVATRDIASRERGLSAMPDGLGDMMSRGELRDLIEALSQ